MKQLATTGPLPAAPMLAALAAHSLPGIQETSGSTVRRLLEVDGTVVPVEIEITDGHVAWRPPAGFSDAVLARVEHTLRRWLDLDRDLAPVHAHLAGDPRLGPLVERWPGLRVVGHPDPFEAAVTTVLGQRVSLAAARVLAARFCEHFSGPPGPVLREFPRPETVAGADPVELRAATGTTAVRARSVVALAEAFAEGLDPTGPPEEVRAQLLALPGLGPWSVEYLAVRVLKDPDAFPAGDLVLQRTLGVATAAEAELLAEPWRPWRAYALFLLWTYGSYLAPPGRAGRRARTAP